MSNATITVCGMHGDKDEEEINTSGDDVDSRSNQLSVYHDPGG